MSIQIIVEDLTNQANLKEAVKAYSFDKEEVTIGSEKNADIVLETDNKTHSKFTAGIDPDAGLFIKCNKQDPNLKINGQNVNDEIPKVGFADEITYEKYAITLNLGFERKKQSTFAKVSVQTTLALLIFVVLVEFSVITWLPGQIRERNLWGKELVRQKTYSLLDTLRNRTRALSTEEAFIARKNVSDMRTLNLVRYEADQIAFYLRRNRYTVSLDTLEQIRSDLNRYNLLIDKLAQGSVFPEAMKLDIKPYLDLRAKQELEKFE